MPAPQVRNVQLAVAIAADGRPKYVISAEAGFTPNLLSGFISGRRMPTPEQIVMLARVLGVLPDSIAPDYTLGIRSHFDGAA